MKKKKHIEKRCPNRNRQGKEARSFAARNNRTRRIKNPRFGHFHMYYQAYILAYFIHFRKCWKDNLITFIFSKQSKKDNKDQAWIQIIPVRSNSFNKLINGESS